MLWVTTALAAVACASGAAYGKRLWIVIGVLLDVPSIYYLFGLPWWVSHDLGRLSIALALLILVTGLTRRARLVLWASIGLLFLVQFRPWEWRPSLSLRGNNRRAIIIERGRPALRRGSPGRRS